jgi:hypothetical protein
MVIIEIQQLVFLDVVLEASVHTVKWNVQICKCNCKDDDEYLNVDVLKGCLIDHPTNGVFKGGAKGTNAPGGKIF